MVSCHWHHVNGTPTQPGRATWHNTFATALLGNFVKMATWPSVFNSSVFADNNGGKQPGLGNIYFFVTSRTSRVNFRRLDRGAVGESTMARKSAWADQCPRYIDVTFLTRKWQPDQPGHDYW